MQLSRIVEVCTQKAVAELVSFFKLNVDMRISNIVSVSKKYFRVK
jgi:hypothetical protein